MAKKFLTQRLEHDEQRMALDMECYDPLPEKVQAECTLFYQNAPTLCEIRTCKDKKQRVALNYRFPIGFESPQTEFLYRNKLVGNEYFYTQRTTTDVKTVSVAVRVIGQKDDITMTGTEWLTAVEGSEPAGTISTNMEKDVNVVHRTTFNKYKEKEDAKVVAGQK